MYDRCKSCGRSIEKAEDCKLVTNDGVKIITLCKECYEERKRRLSNT